ncbi:MAG: iron ABC transporter permease [Chloroflexi bacterium]|nr:iron ABC transporter permease [Chloroflexota bacterium]
MAERLIRAGPARFHRVSIPWKGVVGVVAGAFVVYLVVVPLLMLVFSSFRATGEQLPFEATTFTLANYERVFTSSLTYRLLWNTFAYGSIALVLSLGLAVAFAWFIERTNAPARPVLVLLAVAPIGVPILVEAMAWALLANPTNGVLNLALRAVFGPGGGGPLNIYSLVGMGVVSGLKMVASAYILVAAVMTRLDPALEEASSTSGASAWTTLRRVTGPLLRPAVLAVGIYLATLIVESFEVPAVLGMPERIFVFSTLIYSAVHTTVGLPNFGLVSSYSAVTVLISGALVYWYHRLAKKQERFAVVTGKGYRPRRIVLSRGWQAVFVSAIGLYALLTAVLPFLVLLWASLGILYTPLSLSSATLDSYKYVAQMPDMLRSIWNTVVISAGSATGTMVLALLISWLAIRTRFFAHWLPDRLTILGVAMPSIVIGLALVFWYIRFPLPIYGSIWIIMLGSTTRFLAYGARVMNAGYLQIHQELEEASETSGAGFWSTMTRVVLPLVWPAFIGGWFWVFIHALRDVTIPIMLYTVDNHTVAIRLWNVWMDQGFFNRGAAIAVPLMLVSVVLSLVLTRRVMMVASEAQSV